MRSFNRWSIGEGPVWAYAIAVMAVAVAFLLRVGLAPVLGQHSPFILFVLPVVFSVLYGGRGPGLLAGLISLVLGLTLTDEPWNSPPLLVSALLFLLVCACIGWLGNNIARQRQSAEAHRARAQEKAQEAAQAGEELNLLLEGATSYAIFMVDPDGSILTWNAGAERLFGHSADEVIGRHCSMFSAEEDSERQAARELEDARREGRVSIESWQLRRDGSEFLADISVTPLRTGKDLRGYAKVIHDVTDRRASERALEKREQHLRSILATVPDAMVVIDERGIMLSFSTAAERLFGYREEEVVGRNVSLLMPSPDRERHDGYLERYLATGDPHIIGIGRIVTGLRMDGTTFPMKLSVGEALTEDQRLFTGFIQDLTERKDFEARLEQLKSELIHVSRLSAMGTMASTLAHELNQPLTAIASYGQAAETLLEGEREPDRELLNEAVSEIAAQALRAGGIVRRLREFVSRGDISKSVEDLPALIGEASALALVGSKEKGVAPRFTYDPQASPVLVDRIQIQQVLINLIRNAIEAMEGAPVRELTVATTLFDDQTVEVKVQDTGPGIAPDVVGNLFEAFNTSKSSGMGLGLSICRTIVEAHGGRIEARNRPEGGAEFRFTLTRISPESAR